jgi:hypothetical protein
MKSWNLSILLLMFSNILLGQSLIDKYQIVRFNLNETELNINHKRCIDTIASNFENNKGSFDHKVKIREVILSSVLCDTEKENLKLSKKRCVSVKRYIKKTFKTKVPKFKYVYRKDYYSDCDSYDHGVRILIMLN